MELGKKGLLSQQKEQTGTVDGRCPVHNINLFEIPTGKIICELCEEDKSKAELQKENKIQEAEAFKRNVVMCHGDLNLPKRLNRYSLENYDTETKGKSDALTSCYNLLKNWPDVGGMVLIGGVGTGKTHLAVGVCKKLCDKGVSCKIATVSQIIRYIKSSWNNKATDQWGHYVDEEDIILDYAGKGFLVIDEVGAQFGSDTERIMITEIINRRYEEERPTMVIGNVKKSEMETNIGARAVDRILHNGFMVIFDWESQRIIA